MSQIVRWLDADDFDAGRNVHINLPSWEASVAVLEKLNGSERSELSLMQVECVGFHVAGGYKGRYLVEVISSEGSLVLVCEDRSDQTPTSIMADDVKDYRTYMVASKSTALVAMKW